MICNGIDPCVLKSEVGQSMGQRWAAYACRMALRSDGKCPSMPTLTDSNRHLHR